MVGEKSHKLMHRTWRHRQLSLQKFVQGSASALQPRVVVFQLQLPVQFLVLGQTPAGQRICHARKRCRIWRHPNLLHFIHDRESSIHLVAQRQGPNHHVVGEDSRLYASLSHFSKDSNCLRWHLLVPVHVEQSSVDLLRQRHAKLFHLPLVCFNALQVEELGSGLHNVLIQSGTCRDSHVSVPGLLSKSHCLHQVTQTGSGLCIP
mmetsp:Transcript_10678/g.32687  ORF Transcript_10678/g.32687 Transcript_10678/m.32687 type:complete len:205 (+) Transcript_10678:1519-2133(+)